MSEDPGPRELELAELTGAARFLAYAMLPPLFLWQVGRVLATETVPSLARTVGGALAACALAIAQRVRQLASLIGDPLLGLAVEVWGWLGRAFMAPVLQIVQHAFRLSRAIGVRLVVLVRGVAASIAATARGLAGVFARLAQRVAAAAAIFVEACLRISRLLWTTVREVAVPAFVACRGLVRAAAIAIRGTWTVLGSLARRASIALRGAISAILRGIARPLGAAVRALRVLASAVARAVATVAANFGAVARRALARLAEIGRRLGEVAARVAAFLNDLVRTLSAAAGRFGRSFMHAFRSALEPLRRLGQRVVALVRRIRCLVMNIAREFGSRIAALVDKVAATLRSIGEHFRRVLAVPIDAIGMAIAQAWRVCSSVWQLAAWQVAAVRALASAAVAAAGRFVRTSIASALLAVRQATGRRRA